MKTGDRVRVRQGTGRLVPGSLLGKTGTVLEASSYIVLVRLDEPWFEERDRHLSPAILEPEAR